MSTLRVPRRASAIALSAAIVCGAVLRLVWVTDIEYKSDEARIFASTQRVGRTEGLPPVGHRSSVGIPFPGLSTWSFIVLARALGSNDPPTLARGVQLLSVAAIALLVAFAVRAVPRQEREVWLWAAALAAVNPLAVLYHRKIWEPSLVPLFSVLTIASWWFRQRRMGAFLWGLVGALPGQLHFSGFAFTAALVGWTALFERRRVDWLSWAAGSCIGILPMIPWIRYMWELSPTSVSSLGAIHPVRAEFWMRWVAEPIGIGVEYSLGPQFGDFLGFPIVYGRSTYLTAIVYAATIAVGASILARALMWIARQRHCLRDLWVGRESSTALAQSAALWGFGILLTACTVRIPHHYLIAAFPLGFVWLARMALLPATGGSAPAPLGRILLAATCVLQLLLSASFLSYIHVNQGAASGPYGRAWAAQQTPPGAPR